MHKKCVFCNLISEKSNRFKNCVSIKICNKTKVVYYQIGA